MGAKNYQILLRHFKDKNKNVRWSHVFEPRYMLHFTKQQQCKELLQRTSSESEYI